MTEPVQLEFQFDPPPPRKENLFKFLYGAKLDHDMTAQLQEYQRRMADTFISSMMLHPSVISAERLTATEVSELQRTGRTARLVSYRETEERLVAHRVDYRGRVYPLTGRRVSHVVVDDLGVVRTAGVEPA